MTQKQKTMIPTLSDKMIYSFPHFPPSLIHSKPPFDERMSQTCVSPKAWSCEKRYFNLPSIQWAVDVCICSNHANRKRKNHSSRESNDLRRWRWTRRRLHQMLDRRISDSTRTRPEWRPTDGGRERERNSGRAAGDGSGAGRARAGWAYRVNFSHPLLCLQWYVDRNGNLPT